MSTGTIVAFDYRPCFGVASYENVLVITLGTNQNRAPEVKCLLVGAVIGGSRTA